MEDSSELYKKLKQNTGIDFEELREKYKNRAISESPSTHSDESIAAAMEAHARLDKYVICKSCNGSGFTKVVYNHFVKDVNCPECEGESIVLSSHVDQLAKELRDEEKTTSRT
jgi:DnaJ-class molecular chaperone